MVLKGTGFSPYIQKIKRWALAHAYAYSAATTSAMTPLGQFQFPFLANQVMAEAVMRLFFNQVEACMLVNAMRSGQNALGPENDLPIACCAGEPDTLVH